MNFPFCLVKVTIIQIVGVLICFADSKQDTNSSGPVKAVVQDKSPPTKTKNAKSASSTQPPPQMRPDKPSETPSAAEQKRSPPSGTRDEPPPTVKPRDTSVQDLSLADVSGKDDPGNGVEQDAGLTPPSPPKSARGRRNDKSSSILQRRAKVVGVNKGMHANTYTAIQLPLQERSFVCTITRCMQSVIDKCLLQFEISCWRTTYLFAHQKVLRDAHNVFLALQVV